MHETVKSHNLFEIVCLVVACVFSFSRLTFSQTIDENYVISEIPGIPVTDTATLNDLGWKDKLVTTDFYDGSCRVFQKTNVHASPSGNNLVSFYQFDLAGRQTTDFLPFPSEATKTNLVKDPIEQLKAFYHTPSDEVTPSDYPYAEKQYL